MMMAFCSTKLRIAILRDEIALWEKRCDTEPRSNLYYGYIRDMMKGRVKELEDHEKNLTFLSGAGTI